MYERFRIVVTYFGALEIYGRVVHQSAKGGK